ncbi:MAG: hypothetical protein RL676_566, partial [Pseudomonadota bacterium]
MKTFYQRIVAATLAVTLTATSVGLSAQQP